MTRLGLWGSADLCRLVSAGFGMPLTGIGYRGIQRIAMTEKPIAIRFTDEMLARFERVAEALAIRAAGTRVTRSDAIRAAAERGLVELETELGLKRPKPKR